MMRWFTKNHEADPDPPEVAKARQLREQTMKLVERAEDAACRIEKLLADQERRNGSRPPEGRGSGEQERPRG